MHSFQYLINISNHVNIAFSLFLSYYLHSESLLLVLHEDVSFKKKFSIFNYTLLITIKTTNKQNKTKQKVGRL